MYCIVRCVYRVNVTVTHIVAYKIRLFFFFFARSYFRLMCVNVWLSFFSLSIVSFPCFYFVVILFFHFHFHIGRVIRKEMKWKSLMKINRMCSSVFNFLFLPCFHNTYNNHNKWGKKKRKEEMKIWSGIKKITSIFRGLYRSTLLWMLSRCWNVYFWSFAKWMKWIEY